MIRVTHIITGLAADGAERMLQRLITHMDPDRFRNDVISLTTRGELANDLERAGIPVCALGLSQNPLSLARVARMRKLLSDSQPDVVQTWMYHSDLLGGMAARQAGIRRVVWGIHHSSLRWDTDRTTTIAVAKVCALLSRFIPFRVVCCSEASRRAHTAFGYQSGKTEMIPNGFDLEWYQPNASARREFRNGIGVEPDQLVVGMAARFHPHKDHANFLNAAGLLLQRFPQLVFVLCGRGVVWSNPEFRAVARGFEGEDRLRLLGPLPDTRQFLAGLDVAVSSSRTEAFPLAVGESMASGVPCVVTDVGDSALLVGDTGRVVVPHEARALAEGIGSLIALQSESRQALGRAARQRITARFSLQSVVMQYQDLYSRAVLN